jgi:hypothetical protein
MEMSNTTPDYQVYVVQRNSYPPNQNQPASSKWAVYPGLVVASPGKTLGWKVQDSKDLPITLKDIGNLFEAGSFAQSGKEATATIREGAAPGYYEYRFFWGKDEAQGGSAPGVIIE